MGGFDGDVIESTVDLEHIESAFDDSVPVAFVGRCSTLCIIDDGDEDILDDEVGYFVESVLAL